MSRNETFRRDPQTPGDDQRRPQIISSYNLYPQSRHHPARHIAPHQIELCNSDPGPARGQTDPQASLEAAFQLLKKLGVRDNKLPNRNRSHRSTKNLNPLLLITSLQTDPAFAKDGATGRG